MEFCIDGVCSELERRNIPEMEAESYVPLQLVVIALTETVERLWKKSPRYEKMPCIDLGTKLNGFAKITNYIHHERASLLFQLRTRHVPLNAYL